MECEVIREQNNICPAIPKYQYQFGGTVSRFLGGDTCDNNGSYSYIILWFTLYINLV